MNRTGKKTQDIIVIDAISFFGGSKVATHALLSLLKQEGYSITILTSTPNDWCSEEYQIKRYFELPFIQKREHGILYFVKHLWIALTLLFNWLKLERSAPILGASGPGVDLSMYMVSLVARCNIIQLVHGPVAPSQTIARCLRRANMIAYLPSTKKSIEKCLSTINTNTKKIAVKNCLLAYNNGIPTSTWPSATCSSFDRPHIFWAASLLKWKRLDVLCNALNQFNLDTPHSTICYITPQHTDHELCAVPTGNKKLKYIESPENLDEIRANANIFVSTSYKEPFGLSILEALAAGLCVIIPRDSSYWDLQLREGVNCLKYEPQDHCDLAKVLREISHDMKTAKEIATQGKIFANRYRAEKTLKPLVTCINSLCSPKNLRTGIQHAAEEYHS